MAFFRIIFFVLAGSLTAALASADTLGTPYLRLNVSLDQQAFNSHSSFVGWRGDMPLSDDVALIYQAEIQLDLALDDTRHIPKRNSYIGVKSTWGKLLAGIHNTPLKTLQTSLDVFNTNIGDIKYVMLGETREQNLAMYVSPRWSHLQWQFATIHYPQTLGQNRHKGFSSALKYNHRGVFAGVAINRNVVSANLIEDHFDIVRLGAGYQFGKTRVGGFLQSARDGQDAQQHYRQQSWFFSAKHRFNSRWGLRGQRGFTRDEVAQTTKHQTTLGIDYFLTQHKRFTLFSSTLVQENTTENTLGLSFEWLWQGR
ncbi:MAG: hypothetical protein RL336_1808 [Pseudomonadota bacterium]|jgi:hypothetical protein